MQRHASLIPLSREHHDGLVVAQRLILGRSTNPRAAWPATPAGQRDRLLEFYEQALGPHFEFEERDVFPLVTAGRRERRGATLVAELIADHALMRGMIRGLATEPTARLPARLAELGERLRAHIRREERQLFEWIQADCTDAELGRLAHKSRTHAEAAAQRICHVDGG